MAILSSKLQEARNSLLPYSGASARPLQPLETGDHNIIKKRKCVQIGPSVQIVSYDSALPISDPESPVHIRTRATNFEEYDRVKTTKCRESTTRRKKKSVHIGPTVRELTFDCALPPSDIRRCPETWTKATKSANPTETQTTRLSYFCGAGATEFAEFSIAFCARMYDGNQEDREYADCWRTFLMKQEAARLWSRDLEYDGDCED